MKTAMQDFIEYLEEIKERDSIPSHVITTAKNYLEIEKKQIIKAYNKGNRAEFYDGSEESGESYYNETFEHQ